MASVLTALRWLSLFHRWRNWALEKFTFLENPSAVCDQTDLKNKFLNSRTKSSDSEPSTLSHDGYTPRPVCMFRALEIQRKGDLSILVQRGHLGVPGSGDSISKGMRWNSMVCVIEIWKFGISFIRLVFPFRSFWTRRWQGLWPEPCNRHGPSSKMSSDHFSASRAGWLWVGSSFCLSPSIFNL